MKRLLNRLGAIALSVLAGLGGSSPHAQSPSASPGNFPSKPIRWIVPYPAGGPSDLVARIVGQRLGEHLKQPVIVDNRAGALGNMGMEAAARAMPDGYTIFFGTTTVVISPSLYKLNFDPMTELTTISQLTTVTYVLLANMDFPPRTVSEVLGAAKVRPGTVTCGYGAPIFLLFCKLLNIQGQVDISAVPYKGQAPAMNDLVSGQINLLFDTPHTAFPQVKANRVRAIATTNPKRGTGPFGHLPTVSETLPRFEFVNWFGVLAPTATPREIVARLNREIAAVLEEEDVRKRLTDSGLDVAHESPEAFAEIMRRDHARYSKLIREAGITPE